MAIFPCKSDRKVTVYPGQFISVDLPTNMKQIKYVSCAQSKAQYSWVGVRNILVENDGSVKIRNDSRFPITLSKYEHFANFSPCVDISVDDLTGNAIQKIYDINREDLSHLIPRTGKEDAELEKRNYLDKIIVDPDNMLPDI